MASASTANATFLIAFMLASGLNGEVPTGRAGFCTRDSPILQIRLDSTPEKQAMSITF
jgi:hypothetical protein